MNEFVIYSGKGEVLVTTKELETAMLQEWFCGTGRNREEYDREVNMETAVRITCHMHAEHNLG